MPHTQITIVLDEPVDQLIAPVREAWEGHGLKVAVEGDSLSVIESSAYLHDEATLLDTDELAEARSALIEDGVFSREDWLQSYVAEGWDRDVALRAAVKYGWALAHLETVLRDSTHQRLTAWSIADGYETTTALEFKFLTAELHRRGLNVGWISPCTPARFEPGVDYGGDPDLFARWLNALSTGASVGLMLPNAAGKSSVLPVVAARSDMPFALQFRRFGWMEGLRIVARLEPAFFRELLALAQEHFVFDKGPHALSTAEDDVRSLPGVADGDLEATFLDDFRGRQLLHVTARSLVTDESRRERFAAIFTAGRADLQALLAGVIRLHLDALKAA